MQVRKSEVDFDSRLSTPALPERGAPSCSGPIDRAALSRSACKNPVMGTKVLLIHPHFSMEMPEFVRALVDVGAVVHGVSETPLEALPATVRPYLSSHHVVSSLMDEAGSRLRSTPPPLFSPGTSRNALKAPSLRGFLLSARWATPPVSVELPHVWR